MNIDTDTQYAFTRPAAGHMFTNYDGVLKVDGEVGNKKAYDPRAWGKAAEAGMAAARRRGLRGPAQRRHLAQRLSRLDGLSRTDEAPRARRRASKAADVGRGTRTRDLPRRSLQL